MENIKIGVLGVGAISGIYLQNLTRLFSGVCVEAVCDIVPEKAKKAAEEYGIPKVYGRFEEMFADPEIESSVISLFIAIGGEGGTPNWW